MNIDLDKIIANFTSNHFGVEVVNHTIVNPGSKGFEKTAHLPGFIFPIKGIAKYSFNEIPYTSEIGTIIHGGANMDLGKQVISSSKHEHILVLYDMNYSNAEKLNLHDMSFKLDIRKNTKLTSLLWKLKNISEENTEIASFKKQNIFRLILEEVFISVQNFHDGAIESLFKQVLSYIHSNYMDGINVKELAEKNEVTENQLFYAFNKYTGMGAGEYIKQCRLNCAKKLLMDSENTICMISESVGYMDPLHFSRIFKKNFGMAPSIYREKFRNNPYDI